MSSTGEGPGRIYQVEPTGPIEDDLNPTDKKFPGNPTRSYRTRHPLRVVGEISGWEPHPPSVRSFQEAKEIGTLAKPPGPDELSPAVATNTHPVEQGLVPDPRGPVGAWAVTVKGAVPPPFSTTTNGCAAS